MIAYVAEMRKMKLLVHNESSYVDMKSTFYMLNPESDLPNIPETFSKWFEKIKYWKKLNIKKTKDNDHTTAMESKDINENIPYSIKNDLVQFLHNLHIILNLYIYRRLNH